ncbi:MAG TPA: cytidine/deoxycytidylate deaminase family protein [bacterium]|nr:cytidine/deoxycytidylate deaminase family protein [bacterium]
MENTNPQTEKYIRPSWDEYFMNIASQVASRATCDRGRSGCVIAKNKQILATGYVGSPIGLAHCDQIGHQLHSVTHEDGHVSQHCIRTTHAEQNAICQAAKLGIALAGATLYCKMTPCYVCAKMIINVGIKRVVCEKDYHTGDLSKEIFKQAGVELMIINPLIEQYDHQ